MLSFCPVGSSSTMTFLCNHTSSVFSAVPSAQEITVLRASSDVDRFWHVAFHGGEQGQRLVSPPCIRTSAVSIQEARFMDGFSFYMQVPHLVAGTYTCTSVPCSTVTFGPFVHMSVWFILIHLSLRTLLYMELFPLQGLFLWWVCEIGHGQNHGINGINTEYSKVHLRS